MLKYLDLTSLMIRANGDINNTLELQKFLKIGGKSAKNTETIIVDLCNASTSFSTFFTKTLDSGLRNVHSD